MLKHLLDFLIESLRILFWIAGQIAARRSSPNQLLGIAIEHAHDERSYFVAVDTCGRISNTTPAAPTGKAVIEGVVLLMYRGLLDCYESNVSAGPHLRPAFAC